MLTIGAEHSPATLAVGRIAILVMAARSPLDVPLDHTDSAVTAACTDASSAMVSVC
jgi:hypothetical protein